MRKFGLILIVTCLLFLMIVGTASASLIDNRGDRVVEMSASNCSLCHGGAVGRTAGPHGGYTTTTTRCSTCHTVHSNVADNGKVGQNAKLLPGATITAVCNYCHDLTGSVSAPYYTNYMTSNQVQSAHKVSGLSYWTDGRAVGEGTVNDPEVAGAVYNSANPGAIIPGGDAATGGSLAYAGLLQQGDWSGSTFTCDSCHTPHSIIGQTVNPYFGESRRKDAGSYMYAGSRLLKKKLTVDGGTYENYGSQWCAGCHMGRLTMAGANYNHPVNTNGPGYNFGLVVFNTIGGTTPVPDAYAAVPGANQAAKIAAINTGVTTGDAANGTIAKTLAYGEEGIAIVNGTTIDRYLSASPRLNSWYTMTAVDVLNNNAARPDGYLPISLFRSETVGVNGPSCQQCHASMRDVEAAFGEETTIFSFPHISETKYLLVEHDTDDLCTNCHGLDNLP